MKRLAQALRNSSRLINSETARIVANRQYAAWTCFVVWAATLPTLGIITLTSCAGRPLKGGKALTSRSAGGAVQQSLSQGDNPAQASRQEQETVLVRTYTVPTGARLEDLSTNLHALVLNAPMPVIEREETRAKTELGAAQKDNSREFVAKLSGLRGITWVGLAIFLLGLASLAWPPLRVLVGSVTTSAAILLGGLALMILPTLIVGNELLILGAVTLVIGAWFLAHRHGQLRGLLSSNSSSVPNLPTPPLGEEQSKKPAN
jgi:hypothetical protein